MGTGTTFTAPPLETGWGIFDGEISLIDRVPSAADWETSLGITVAGVDEPLVCVACKAFDGTSKIIQLTYQHFSILHVPVRCSCSS